MSNKLNRKQRRRQMLTQGQIKDMVRQERISIADEIRQDVFDSLDSEYEEKVFLSFGAALNKLYGFAGKRISDVWYLADEIRGQMNRDAKMVDFYRNHLKEKAKIAYGVEE